MKGVSEMNPILKEMLESRDLYAVKSAILIFSCLRGPDCENLEFKKKFSAPIRLWILGPEQYKVMCYYPESPADVLTLTKDNINTLMSDLGKSDGLHSEMTYHFYSHILLTLQKIKELEGWNR
jgi:hypothetical protein